MPRKKIRKGRDNSLQVFRFIKSPSSVVATMECELVQEARVADHVVAIAKVKEFEARQPLTPTLLYHESTYKAYDGTVLHRHTSKPNSVGDAKKLTADDVYFDYSLFPGEAEKEDFISRLKEFIKEDEEVLSGSSRDGALALQRNWRVVFGAFGISTEHLVDQVKVELGLPSSLDSMTKDLSVTRRFYGRLSSANIATIIDRAKKLVHANPMVLSMDFKAFQALLDIHPTSTGLLVSDILDPLRKDGLVAPFDPQSINLNVKNTEEANGIMAETFELIEYRLREYFKTIPYSQAYKMKSEDLQKIIGETKFVDTYIRRVRERIMTEVYPELFSPSNFDIKGRVTSQEISVIVNRLIRQLDISNPHRFVVRTHIPKIELLRQIRVHPMVSGIDLDFLFGKLQHKIKQATSVRKIRGTVEIILAQYFEKGSWDWSELQSRLRVLVASHTLQVMKWAHEDLVAAMGFYFNLKFEYPVAKASPLVQQDLLGVLMAKELKARYESSAATPEEQDAIAAFLKTKYDHDVSASSDTNPDNMGTQRSSDADFSQKSTKESEFLDALDKIETWTPVNRSGIDEPIGQIQPGIPWKKKMQRHPDSLVRKTTSVATFEREKGQLNWLLRKGGRDSMRANREKNNGTTGSLQVKSH
ncbi:hypothetical protein N0V90_010331 [Kalmusia sp. IMI 367209]|nr:hypothetical protein N0V90_010331 [Kalmusia sp. IMI 367209]